MNQLIDHVRLAIAHWLGGDEGLESPLTGHFTCQVPEPLVVSVGSGRSSYRSIQSFVDGLCSKMLVIGGKGGGPTPVHPSISIAVARDDRQDGRGAARDAAIASLGPESPYILGETDLAEAADRYRSDLAAASTLVRWLSGGDMHAMWRPICRAAPSECTLAHALDGLLPRGATSAFSIDEVQDLFGRLGLSSFLDQYLVRLSIDRLGLDPLATMIVPITAQSANDGFLWQTCFERIRAERGIASRLILSIGGQRSSDPAVHLKRFAKNARSAGLRIAIRDFGAGAASWQELLCAAPDIVELSPALARLAPASERSQEALRALLMFLNASGRWQIITSGVDNDMAAQVAADCGATWIAGGQCGIQRTGYPFFMTS